MRELRRTTMPVGSGGCGESPTLTDDGRRMCESGAGGAIGMMTESADARRGKGVMVSVAASMSRAFAPPFSEVDEANAPSIETESRIGRA